MILFLCYRLFDCFSPYTPSLVPHPDVLCIRTKIIIDRFLFVSVATLDIYAHDYFNQDLLLMLQSTIKYLFSIFLCVY